MNFDRYEDAWRSASAPAPVQSQVESLIGNMTRRERRGRRVLGVCVSATIAVLLATVSILLFRRPLEWNELLPVMVLQVLFTAGLVAVVRRHRERRRALALAGLSVVESARTGLANVNSRMRDLRLLSVLAIVFVPLIAVAVYQLTISGKMNAQAVRSFALVCAVILGGNAAVQWYSYRRTLVPQRTRLQEILASLGEEA